MRISASISDLLSLEDLMLLKPAGHFRIEQLRGRWVITVHRPDRPAEVIHCRGPGHANQLRQDLSDQGLACLEEGTL